MELQELLAKHNVSVQAEGANAGYVWIGPFKNEHDSHVCLAAISMGEVDDIPEQHYIMPTRPASTESNPYYAAILIGTRHLLYPKLDQVA